MHPGTPLKAVLYEGPRDVAVLAIRIPDLIVRVQNEAILEATLSVYIYDSTDDPDNPPFIGGAKLFRDTLDSSGLVEFTPETELAALQQNEGYYHMEKTIVIASRQWTFVVLADNSEFKPAFGFAIFGSVIIFVACVLLAIWVHTSSRRATRFQEIKSDAEAERAKMKVESARRAAKTERELNDFIAHEVRNPLAAAMSACSFVSASVNEAEPLVNEESRKSVREDVSIITHSLHFINDLLRNMLDMHRALSQQMKLTMSHVDLLGDVLQPVASMLYRRGDNFEVLVECPQPLVVMGDVIRLKQIIINLGRNSVKFVSQGFVRLRATVVHNNVQLFVEDSGPGIPAEKRVQLFEKFQESLDTLNQGTGIGLALCKNLVDLMGGEIYLDEHYDSGVEGYPGARFVIDLKTSPVRFESLGVLVEDGKASDDAHAKEEKTAFEPELPAGLTVLFVDDAFVLRKLFGRAVAKVTSGWEIHEAANGETCLRMAEERRYDLIFVDQYMASAEKQLLGTETIRALRSNGCKSKIVGLSANDLEKAFLGAGADSFIMKPFPCEKEELRRELRRVLKLDQVQSLEHNKGTSAA